MRLRRVGCRVPQPWSVWSDQQADKKVGDEGGDGDGEDPGPDHALDDGPFDGVETAGSADAHDGGGDVVRGGDGNTEERGGKDDGGGAGLGGEAVDWVQLHHFMAQGFDDSPTTNCGA